MPFRSVVLLTVFAVAACTEAAAPLPCTYEDDVACWTHLGLENAWVISLADTPAGIFAGTRGNGVWKYEGRTSWSPRGLGTMRVTALLSQRDGSGPMLFAATAHFSDSTAMTAPLFVSRDAGTTWTERDGGVGALSGFVAGASSLAADTMVPGRIFAGLFSAIMRSNDFGATWTIVSGHPSQPGPSNAALAVSRSGNVARIWAGGMRSTGDASVRYSDDHGATWISSARPGFVEDFVTSLIADERDRDHLYAGMIGAVRETRDGGASWTVAVSLAGPGYMSALVRTAGRIVGVADETAPPVGTSALGVYRSSSGALWDTLPVPPTASGGYSIVEGSSGTLLVGTRTGVWRVQFK